MLDYLIKDTQRLEREERRVLLEKILQNVGVKVVSLTIYLETKFVMEETFWTHWSEGRV